MTTFDDRESAHENKFARDNETDFKVIARRNKLLGLWAAEKLHLKEDERESYAKDVMAADFEEPGDGDVLRKVTGDFEKAGLSIAEKEVREQMHALMAVAREQVHNS
jgi:hypothetical protein